MRKALLLLALFIGFEQGALAASGRGPRSVISLNGEWQCQPGERDRPPAIWTYRVAVPGLMDLCVPELKWEEHDYFWYRTTFRLRSGQAATTAIVKLDLSKYGTEVWLNGKSLGSYNGCYTSHEYDAAGALNEYGENVLLVRVGRKHTLPEDNGAGGDAEKQSFIPGIWGDVSLILTGDPRIRAVRVLPRIGEKIAEATVLLSTKPGRSRQVTVTALVREKKSGKNASAEMSKQTTVTPGQNNEVALSIPLPDMHLWSPEDPFLYELLAEVETDDGRTDRFTTTFGMRDFRVKGSDFYLNGKRIFLRGGNIVFHRFLSDPERRHLPWNMAWVKKALIDIPKQHNFNYFRIHMGHAYNRWYDIADRYGMLIQNEWLFWGRLSGGEATVRREFSQWLEDNYNHPSIVIWDPVNEWEGSEAALAELRMIEKKVIPSLKQVDPMRPWEVADFLEEHPYIYSLGPVLNNDRFGFSRSLADIEKSERPTVLNEFVWFWLRNDGEPTHLADEVVLRWLGNGSTAKERLEYQAFLAAELVEQFRRMRVDGIAPFVYVGPNSGPTANWFLGDISRLRPKPILAALKNAFAPFGVSVELWDRHFFTSEHRRINVYVFNDLPEPKTGELTCRIRGRRRVVYEHQQAVTVPGSGMQVIPVDWPLPIKPGEYRIEAELDPADRSLPTARSRKIAHVFEPVEAPAALKDKRIVVHDPDHEILRFLGAMDLNAVSLDQARLRAGDLLVVGEGGVTNSLYVSRLAEVTAWVEAGGMLIVVEPTYGVADGEQVKATAHVDLTMRKKDSACRNGYDSAVFPANEKDPFWEGISTKHLSFFNGGYGGIIVSDYDIIPSGLYLPRAFSGLRLGTAALLEIPAENGAVILSRLQVRGRLLATHDESDLYARRIDPVAQRYLLNLLATYTRYRTRGIVPITGTTRASSGNEGELRAAYATDDIPGTRWSSASSDPQWIVHDLGSTKRIRGLKLNWEAAYGKEYKIMVSNDGRSWTTVFHEANGDGEVDELFFEPVSARYVCLLGLQRGTGWGYSLWDMSVFTGR